VPEGPTIAPADITALVLAGGRGSRMGGLDKGLLPFCGSCLAGAVLEAIRPQVGAVLVSANRNLDDYARLGAPVVQDGLPGFQGPLAGILAGLERATTPCLLTLPCDGPFFGPGLVPRLSAALAAAAAEVAVAHDGERLQAAYALIRRDLEPALRAAIAAGERKTQAWYRSRNWTRVDFSDHPEWFLNLNSPEDYRLCGLEPPAQ
jgi:molybdopterin-guanine dinucleotide biosynthesis protein A